MIALIGWLKAVASKFARGHERCLDDEQCERIAQDLRDSAPIGPCCC